MKKKCDIIFEFGAFQSEKRQKMYFWFMWMKDNNSQNALGHAYR